MKIRRLVTGHNKDGKSLIKWDTEIEGTTGRNRFAQVTLWATDSLPARLTDEDPITWNLGTIWPTDPFSEFADMNRGLPSAGIRPIHSIMELSSPERYGCRWMRGRC